MPEQHDPIDELARFGASLGSPNPGGDMPRSPAEVRRRGDQIRRRRAALVAGGAALAVAAVAVPVLAVVGDDDPKSDRDRIAEDVPALAEIDLLRDADTQYFPGQKDAYRTVGTFADDRGDGLARCEQKSLSTLGPTRSFTRTYNFAPVYREGETPEKDLTPYDLVERVAEFTTPEAARAAYDTLGEWILDCRIPGADRLTVVPKARTVDLPGADGVIYSATWTPSPDPYAGYLGEFGLLLQGDRIAVLQQSVIGQDQDWEENRSPVALMMPAVAARLLPEQPTSDRPSAAIPDDFPLTRGWPATAGDGDGPKGPARDLDPVEHAPCGTGLPDPPHEDRLLATYEDAEDYRTRQLTTYADPDAATAAFDDIRQQYVDCPFGPKGADGSTPVWAVHDVAGVGDEAFALLGWDELDGAPTPHGETLLVVRRGGSVLVVVHAGEAGAPSGSTDQGAIDEITQETKDVATRMCAWSTDGC
ncbi:hypothetical protein [Nocardioides sp. LML1-1-1.1]|uniref:hypothetical protein n=1 Tax=Nocardioides sp. LML1-1-1.1 TaxID=3135248 RepID=UPI00343B1774